MTYWFELLLLLLTFMEYSQKLAYSLTIAGQHLTIIRQVQGVVLRVA